jgi:hypothetical protein
MGFSYRVNFREVAIPCATGVLAVEVIKDVADCGHLLAYSFSWHAFPCILNLCLPCTYLESYGISVA